MATDYETYLDRDSVCFVYYATISGIGYVFANFDQPAAWTDLGDRTWDKSFMHFRDPSSGKLSTFDTISEELDLIEGITTSGQVELEMFMDPQNTADTWRKLMVPDGSASQPRDMYYTDPTVPVWPSRQSMYLQRIAAVSGNSLTSQDLLYSGRETMRVRLTPSTTDVLFDRGAFDSEPQWFGRQSVNDTVGAKSLYTWPQQWKGRVVSLWRVACNVGSAGERVPISATVDGSHNQEVFRGEIYNQSLPGGESTVRFMCQSLDQLFERPVVSRARSYRPGPPDGNAQGFVYVEAGGVSLIEYDLGTSWPAIFSLNTTDAGKVIDLTRSGGALDGGGLFTARQVIGAIVEELNTATRSDSGSLGFRYEWAEFEDTMTSVTDRGDAGWSLGFRVRGDGIGGGPLTTNRQIILGSVTLRLGSAVNPEKSLLWALGATKDVVIAPGTDNHADNPQLWSSVLLDKPVPHYFFGAGSTRLYYHDLETVPYDSNIAVRQGNPPVYQGSANRDGTVDFPRIRFGDKEVMEVQFRREGGSNPLFYDTTFTEFTYAKVLQRGMTPKNAEAKHAIVKAGEVDKASNQITLGLLFDNHELMDVLLWCAISNGDTLTVYPWTPGSEFNKLPAGMGAGIPDSYVDVAAFDRIQRTKHPIADGLWIEGSTTLRQLMGMVGAVYGLTFIPTQVASTSRRLGGRFQLSVVEDMPVTASEEPVAVIDSGWYNSTQNPVVLDRNEREIINAVEYEFAYDPMQKAYTAKSNTIRNIESIANFGESRKVKLQMPWIQNFGGAASAALSADNAFVRTMGQPHVIITIPFILTSGWKVRLNNTVALTHAFLLDFKSGGQGLTKEPMKVIGRSESMGPSAGTHGTLKLVWRPDVVVREYVPNLRLTEDLGSNEYRVATDMNEGGFSDPSDAKGDIDHYAASATSPGWFVVAEVPGDASTQNSLRVTAIDLTVPSITFDGAVSTAMGDTIVTFDSYDNFDDNTAGDVAIPQQQDYVHQCDATDLDLTDTDSVVREGDRWY